MVTSTYLPIYLCVSSASSASSASSDSCDICDICDSCGSCDGCNSSDEKIGHYFLYVTSCDKTKKPSVVTKLKNSN